MKDVRGWSCAKTRSTPGVVSVGTNPLPRNGSMSSTVARLLADFRAEDGDGRCRL